MSSASGLLMEPSDIQGLVESLVRATGVACGAVRVSDANGRIVCSVDTADSKLLIGHGGETLRALNHLAKRLAEARDSAPARFVVDVNGYYADKIGRLEREALLLAERVRTFKYDIEMSPMNPYDRMLVHEALRTLPSVATESRGEGAARHIVILYKPDATPQS